MEWSETTRADGQTTDFYLHSKELHSYLTQFGSSGEKYIPEDLLSWDKEHLEVLLEWLLKGDGRNRKVRGKLLREYYTTSEKLANSVSKLFLKLGSGSRIFSYNQKDRLIGGRLVEAKNSKPMFVVCEHVAKGISLDLRFLTVEEVDHDSNVYCVTTPNGNWMAQRNGKMFWTGNCDHPDSSVVNLKNASHIIRKAYMENGVVYGTIELLNTPSGKILQSLVESGITLGISSRGLGSTVEKGDYQIVQDDFQLICWDFVSEPSTPGAFMMKESLDATRAKKMMAVFDKSDRVYRAVTDILNW
jgi:hypothetical protein